MSALSTTRNRVCTIIHEKSRNRIVHNGDFRQTLFEAVNDFFKPLRYIKGIAKLPALTAFIARNILNNNNRIFKGCGECSCAVFHITFTEKTSHFFTTFLVFISFSHFLVWGRLTMYTAVWGSYRKQKTIWIIIYDGCSTEKSALNEIPIYPQSGQPLLCTIL